MDSITARFIAHIAASFRIRARTMAHVNETMVHDPRMDGVSLLPSLDAMTVVTPDDER